MSCVPFTCNDKSVNVLGERDRLHGWCGDGKSTGAGRYERSEACLSIGKRGEYGEENISGKCGDDGYPITCGTNKDFIRSGVSCRRLQFLGDVPTCCQQVFDPSVSKCFTRGDPSLGTCPPDARSATGSLCRDYYLTFCTSPANVNDSSKFDLYWRGNGLCRRVYQENSSDIAYTENLGTGLLTSFFSQNSLLEPGEPGYNPDQETIYEFCKETPYFCRRFLSDSLCLIKTRQDLIGRDTARDFCGCYLQNKNYEEFGNEVAGISRECDPICIPASTIKYLGPGSSQPTTCQSTICLIEDVNISLINSSTGEINFNTVCGGCGAAGCSCFIKDINLITNNSALENLNFINNCSQLQCYQTQSDGSYRAVDCETFDENGETIPPSDSSREREGFNKTLIIIIVVISLILFLLFIFAIIFILRRKRSQGVK